jgi:uncharacterized LabA/DUF88 family protein
MKRRAIVYVDGLNLYFGALKGGKDKWLDLAAYFRRLRQADEIQRIHFFTAEVTGPTLENQRAYLRALATTPLVHVVLGKFKHKNVVCRVNGCGYEGRRVFSFPAEKRTDVHIAFQMLEDAYEDRAKVFVVVSGDSDLVPAVHRVRSRFPHKRVVVYVPARDPDRSAAVELRSAANDARDLPLALLPRCQFPPTLPDGHGGTVTKPPAW